MIKNLSHDTVSITCPYLKGEQYTIEGLDQKKPQSENTEL
jgi:hypothetical protein